MVTYWPFGLAVLSCSSCSRDPSGSVVQTCGWFVSDGYLFGIVQSPPIPASAAHTAMLRRVVAWMFGGGSCRVTAMVSPMCSGPVGVMVRLGCLIGGVVAGSW